MQRQASKVRQVRPAGRVVCSVDTPPRSVLAHVLKTAPGSDDFKARVDVNRDIAWAPGWGVDRSSKSPSLFHWGDGPGFKNFCWVQPARRSALVLFTNGDSGAALYAWLFRQLMNEDPSVFYWI